MNATVKVTTIGNSVGIILPKEVLAELNVEKGDNLYLSSAPDGVRLTPYQEGFSDQMKALNYVMRKHRDALRKLAE